MQTIPTSTVTSVEAKNRLGQLIAMVQKNPEDILIQNHGKPRAVLLSYKKYEAIQQKLKQAQIQQAWGALQKAREQVQKRKSVKTNQDADSIIRKATNEAMKELSNKKVIPFA